MTTNIRANWFLFFSILLIILIDQVSKTWVFLNLQGQETFSGFRDVIIIKNVLRLTYLENPGMVFGIRTGNEIFLSLLATVASVLMFCLIYRNMNYLHHYRYAIGFILGGAIGNQIDRFIYGMVIDFIYIELINWPVFNFADVAVLTGMLLGIFEVFINRSEPVLVEQEEEKVVWIDGEKIPSDEVIR